MEQSQEYLRSMLDWSRNAEQTWDQFLNQMGHVIEKENMDDWESELRDLIQDITEALDMRYHSTYLNEKIVKIQDRSKNLYHDWKSFFDILQKNPTHIKSSVANERLQPVPVGGHTLPPLPYAYDALEPYINEEIMRLHHTEHHQGYVDGLNKAEKEMAKARKTGDYDLIRHWEREAAFNGAGHYLHTIFCNVMGPEGGGQPSGDLVKQIDQDFGSFDKFTEHFTEAAKKVEGVGWAILVWAPRAQRLEILQAEKHQNLSQQDVIPLVVLDVWEHAYYLQYKNNRGHYVDNWWNIVNWDVVQQRFHSAKTLRWTPY